MPNIILYDDGTHRNIMLEDFDAGGFAVQSNQHVIIHGSEGMILDPGGHKIYNRVLTATFSALGGAKLRHIFLSHQDPDIVAAVNGWLMTTDADAHLSALWTRFVAHFGLDHLVEDRLKAIPDAGILLELDGLKLPVIPAHFLHSEGNFQLYDPVSKILYTGDLGTSLGAPYVCVENFDEHLKYIEGFHSRFMTANQVMRAWANMVRTLDIEIIAPQHGAYYKGKDVVKRFIDWAEELKCGVDLIVPWYKVPAA